MQDDNVFDIKRIDLSSLGIRNAYDLNPDQIAEILGEFHKKLKEL
jgi:hypothetical protein